MVWVAMSLRDSNQDVDLYPHAVLLDSPVHVVGEPEGEMVAWQFQVLGSCAVGWEMMPPQAAGARQWVTMQFSPGNTLQPLRPLSGGTVTHAGSIVIEPPQGFKVSLAT